VKYKWLKDGDGTWFAIPVKFVLLRVTLPPAHDNYVWEVCSYMWENGTDKKEVTILHIGEGPTVRHCIEASEQVYLQEVKE
jgi:hypothetical protein